MSQIDRMVKDHFGLTRDLREVGYILSDGSMLDLTGRHYASGYVRRGDRFVPTRDDYLARTRSVDHREIPMEVKEALGKSGSEAMLAFMKETRALRVMPGVGFSVVSMPTVEAVDAFVKGWNRYYQGDPANIDVLTYPDGYSKDSIELEDPSVEEVMAFLEPNFEAGNPGHRRKGGTMGNPGKRVEDLLEILREIEFIEYEDSDTGLEYFCPICGGRPERERLPKGVREMYPSMGGRGHDKNCKLARAIHGS
jgi:hypothetical protein